MDRRAGTPTIDAELARRRVDTQFPRWADLRLRLLDPAGSDHVIYRLGEELTVRLPRHTGAITQVRKEAEWLPRLAPHLPLAVPEPVAVGEPDFGYPWSWAVSRWLPGEVATVEGLSESHEAAGALAGFLAALHRFDAEPAEDLLTAGGRLSAVIDFGELGVGDPARDLVIACTLMSAGTRATFRAALDVDDPTWTRGRGRALETGLNAYVAHAAVNPRVAAQTTRQITQALAG
ncbi:hypothetical protein BBK82_34655 [Lentzea guizhouensis]|uniref:Aminoglycoside phosphotransferase domain-containing protein n=1 Tax=Lentzea guizhouensis TaxID=1586287 RepID=A0A1B2HRS1_9PSEU|nr:phosphotransferase [Lentzea guizhouensis]ANZ40398.1 hypothetical protein BBK82_34655 [Lentzea guizhouensis]